MLYFCYFLFFLLCLLAPSLAVTQAASSCRVSLVENPPSGLLCRRRGSVDDAALVSLVRRVYAASLGACERTCYQDLSCNALRYSTETGSCTTFAERIREGTFRGNPFSKLVFSNYRCYERNGRCPVLNPTFDDANISGGDVSPRPKRAKHGRQQVFLSPWSTLSFGNSYSRLITPDNRTPSLPEPANGEEPNYALMTVAQTEEISLLQFLRLRPNYWHRASFSYNLISYDGEPSSPDNDNTYRVVFVRGNAEDVTTVEPDTTVLGLWDNAGSFSFKSPADAADMQFGVRIEPPQAQNIVKSALFGLDSVTVEACPSNQPCVVNT